MPVIGAKGEVYVVWAGPKGLVFKKSLDGGLSFGKDKVIGAMPGGWDIDICRAPASAPITLSLPKVKPPSSDFLKTNPFGPAQTT